MQIANKSCDHVVEEENAISILCFLINYYALVYAMSALGFIFVYSFFISVLVCFILYPLF